MFLPHLGLSKFDAFSLQNSIQHEKEVLDKFTLTQNTSRILLYTLSQGLLISYIYQALYKSRELQDSIITILYMLRAKRCVLLSLIL